MSETALTPENIPTDGLSAEDLRALAVSMQLDSTEKVNAYKTMLLEKWSGIGRDGKYHVERDWLGEGSVQRGFPTLRNDSAKAVVAILLENQAKFQRSKELPVVNNRVLLQDTTTADEALPTKYAMPIIRRVYSLVVQGDWSVTQPLPGPTGYVFWLDFLREPDGTNLLSVEYNWLLTPELGVPPKGKLQLQRRVVQVTKQLLGMTWSLESIEDARAQLGLDVEGELLGAFSQEFVRNLFSRHLQKIYAAATGTDLTFDPSGRAIGSALPAQWLGPQAAFQIPANPGNLSYMDRRGQIYNALIDADTIFQKNNRIPSDGIVAGYGLASLLRKMLTVTSVAEPDTQNMASVGLSNYGTYEARWIIWGTDFLPDNVGFLYKRSPDSLRASHVYAPYVPVQLMPAVYGDYDPTTGNYQNRDAWTRNIRERSADIITRPYGFQAIIGPAGNAF